MEEKTNTLLPLSGINVVELSTHVAVPRAGRLLAEFGAHVVKIEGPKADEWRGTGRSYDMPCEDDENIYFTLENSNKQLICLNLKTEEGKGVLLRLLEDADIFLSNVRKKSLEKMGLFYDQIKDRFPKLIYCHFTGYGYKGAERNRPGFDTAAFWARTGGQIDWLPKGQIPFQPVSAMGDINTSSLVFSGAMMALYARERTGMGTLVTSSLLASGIWSNAYGVVSAQKRFHFQYPQDYDAPPHPLCQNYQCSDGKWISLVIVDYNGTWERNCEVFDLEEFRDIPAFATIDGIKEGDCRRRLTSAMKKRFLEKDSAYWKQRLDSYDIVYEVIRHYPEVSEDQQAWDNDYLEMVSFPSGEEAILPRAPIDLSAYGKRHMSPAGGKGKDTDAVLRSLGYTQEEINEIIGQCF